MAQVHDPREYITGNQNRLLQRRPRRLLFTPTEYPKTFTNVSITAGGVTHQRGNCFVNIGRVFFMSIDGAAVYFVPDEPCVTDVRLYQQRNCIRLTFCAPSSEKVWTKDTFEIVFGYAADYNLAAEVFW